MQSFMSHLASSITAAFQARTGKQPPSQDAHADTQPATETEPAQPAEKEGQQSAGQLVKGLHWKPAVELPRQKKSTREALQTTVQADKPKGLAKQVSAAAYGISHISLCARAVTDRCKCSASKLAAQKTVHPLQGPSVCVCACVYVYVCVCVCVQLTLADEGASKSSKYKGKGKEDTAGKGWYDLPAQVREHGWGQPCCFQHMRIVCTRSEGATFPGLITLCVCVCVFVFAEDRRGHEAGAASVAAS